MKLDPLICAGCGGPVPLGAGSSVACPQCASRVEIPEAHQQLRMASEKRRADRADLEALFLRLGSPPGAFIQSMAGLAAIWMLFLALTFCAGLIFGVIICIGDFIHNFDLGITEAAFSAVAIALMMVPVLWSYLFHALAPTLGVDVNDMLLGGLHQLLLGLLIYLLIVVPTVLFAWADQFTSLRQKIRAMLAAKPPATEGGAAVCRQCGAALEVATGQPGVICAYCDADNLVNIPPELLKEVKLEAKDFRASLEESDQLEQSIRRENRGWAWRTLRNWLLLIPLLWGLGCLTESLVDDVQRPPRWVYSDQLVSRYHDDLKLGAPSPIEFKSFDNGKIYMFVTLRKGQEVVFQKGPGHLQLQRRQVSKWYAPEWKWESLGEDWHVPYTGWYRLVLEGQGSGELLIERR